MINKIYIISLIILSFFHHNESFAYDCKRSCNNAFKDCINSQNMFSAAQGFVDHKFNNKELRAYMKLPEMSKIDSKKLVYHKNEVYLKIIYTKKNSDKKYVKKISWYDVCETNRQKCIKKC